MTNLSIYCAGPLFSEIEKKRCSIIENICEKKEYKYFSPRLETTEHNKLLAKFSKLLFSRDFSEYTKEQVLKERDRAATGILKENLKGINSSNVVIACIDNRDPGTMFEIGYAIANNKPVITYSFENYGCNIMISQSAIYHSNITEDDTSDLEKILQLLSNYYECRLAHSGVNQPINLKELRETYYNYKEMELE